MKPNPPKLRMIAALWSLTHYPSEKREWSLERKIHAVREAGFDGFSTVPTPESRQLAAKYDLLTLGHISSANPAEFRRRLLDNQAGGAHHINVQLADGDTLTPEALCLTLRLMKEGERLGLEPSVETHRGTCTETPEKAYALAEAYRKATGKLLPMTFDYSHVAVVKHLAPSDYIKKLLVQPKLIQRSQQIHLRPFNGHHCQIPVTDSKGNVTQEIGDWLSFVEQLFRVWRKGNQAGRELFVVPEMGPVFGGYNLSTLPNSWEDALVLKELIHRCWKASAISKRR